MTVLRSVALFILAALAEIGGAWMIWQAVREHKSRWWIGAGIVALGLYGFIATLQPDAAFGRILAAGRSWPDPWCGAWSWTGSNQTATTSPGP